MHAAARQGVVDYLLKPFGQDELRERLERYAAQRLLREGEVHDQDDIDRVPPDAARPGPASCPRG